MAEEKNTEETTDETATPEVVEETTPEAPAADAETPMETADEGGMEEPGEEDLTGGGLTLSPEDLQAQGDLFASMLAPLIEKIDALAQGLDLVKTMSSHVEKFGNTLGAYQTQKDSEAAEQRAAVETLAATVQTQGGKLDELLGVQPAVVTDRPSATATTVVPETDALVQAAKAADELLPAGEFSDMIRNLFGPQALRPPA